MDEHGLWIRFDDQSESYTLGWEAGQLFQRMQLESLIETMVHTKNLNQIQQMATKLGFSCYDTRIENMEEFEDWRNIKLERLLHRVK